MDNRRTFQYAQYTNVLEHGHREIQRIRRSVVFFIRPFGFQGNYFSFTRTSKRKLLCRRFNTKRVSDARITDFLGWKQNKKKKKCSKSLRRKINRLYSGGGVSFHGECAKRLTSKGTGSERKLLSSVR